MRMMKSKSRCYLRIAAQYVIRADVDRGIPVEVGNANRTASR